MPRVFKYLFLLCCGLVLSGGGLRAQNFSARDLTRAQRNGQTPNLYGSNPFDQTGEEDEEGGDRSDSTKRERRIRKPLESYFFDDSLRALPNFRYNISERFNRVQVIDMDSTLENFRIDYPFYREDVGDIAQGALGQSSLPINYFRRSTDPDFLFAQPYDAYTFRLENIPFYNVKRPVTRMTYLESGQKRFREENFGILHAQNVSPTTGFNIDYKARGTRGQYIWSRTKNHTLSVAVNHTGRRYSIHAGYYNNHIEQQENGGVVGEWAIADTVFQMPSGVPMKLAAAEAQNTYRNNAFYVVQSYGIPLQRMTDRDFSMAELSAVYIGHAFGYTSWSKTYTDLRAEYTNERDHRDENGDFVAATDEYYKNWYINPQRSRDSLYERRISNRLFVQAQPWDRNGVVGTIDAGVGVDLHTYSQFAVGDYLTGRFRKVKETSYYLYGAVSGKIKRFVDWDANARFFPTGYRGGDLSVGGHVALTARFRGHPLILDGRFSVERRSPGYWQENLYMNHYMWNAPLERETETRFEVTLSSPRHAFEAGLRQSIVPSDLLRSRCLRRAVRRGERDGSLSAQGFPLRRIPFGQQGIVAVEHGSTGRAGSARRALPLVLLRVLGGAQRAAAAGGYRRSLPYEVLRTVVRPRAVGLLQPAGDRSGGLSLPRCLPHGEVEADADFPQGTASEPGSGRVGRLFLGGRLPAQSAHVQDRYLVGIL